MVILHTWMVPARESTQLRSIFLSIYIKHIFQFFFKDFIEWKFRTERKWPPWTIIEKSSWHRKYGSVPSHLRSKIQQKTHLITLHVLFSLIYYSYVHVRAFHLPNSTSSIYLILSVEIWFTKCSNTQHMEKKFKCKHIYYSVIQLLTSNQFNLECLNQSYFYYWTS